jgi:hypothetical protein
MALRFRQSMFWSWVDGGKARAMVGLSREDEPSIPQLRDALARRLSLRMRLALHREEGRPTSADSYITLFDKGDEGRIARFFSQRIPDLLQRLLKTSGYRAWEMEFAAVRGLCKVEIETNHDFPGVLVYSSAVTAEELSLTIQEVASDLHLELCENRELEKVNVYSNVTLDRPREG